MKYQFKKGDRVKRTGEDCSHLTQGNTYLVTRNIDTDDCYGDFHIINDENQEGTYNVGKFDLVKDYKPQKPTHLVIWEEERDPVKFFPSEKEAKDFIKELSEKSVVKKDSILLIEIKSCKKTTIKKSLVFTEHKI